MILLPAIDIKDNKCVRLRQGKFEKVDIYSEEPWSMAKKWEDMGAEYLHIVDLDGAKDEGFQNMKSIERIAKSVNIPMQIGGGIRDESKIKELLELGFQRVIVGTMAIENKELTTKLARIYKEHLAVSIDALNGKVATRGWQSIEDTDSIEVFKYLDSININTVVYTDISKDGMLEGPNFDIYERLSMVNDINIIASGGVTTVDDIKELNKLNIYGAIIGKALYDNRLDFKDALEAVKEKLEIDGDNYVY